MQSTSENMFLELFCQIISEPCFNTLRTKEQLGKFFHDDNVPAYTYAHTLTAYLRRGEVFFPCLVNAI